MRYIPALHIDTNLINSRQTLPAVNQLEQWFADRVVLINMAGTAREEALAGNDTRRTESASESEADKEGRMLKWILSFSVV
jgi:hypothetical protein